VNLDEDASCPRTCTQLFPSRDAHLSKTKKRRESPNWTQRTALDISFIKFNRKRNPISAKVTTKKKKIQLG